MKFSELSDTRLRKSLNAGRVVKGYNNKHKDGSGNFGFVIHMKKQSDNLLEPCFELHGAYTKDKDVYGLSFGTCSRPVNSISRDWDYRQICTYMIKFILSAEAGV